MATLGLSDAERESIERFERTVIEPSMRELVILDFWAEWCGPCKQLGPVLEKMAAEYAAKGVRLVKIDVDEDKILAAQFRIQSIPTVYAIHKGQPVADLTNSRTDGQLRKAIDQLLAQLKIETEEMAGSAEITPLIAMGEEILGEGDSARALGIFRQLRDMAPDHPAVLGGLIRALLAEGTVDEARSVAESLDPDIAAKPELAQALAALDIASSGATAELGPLEARVKADPADHKARLELAGALMATGRRDEAADHLLDIIAQDRDWNDGAARARFLQMLEAEGLADPWSSAQRRRLSALLFT